MGGILFIYPGCRLTSKHSKDQVINFDWNTLYLHLNFIFNSYDSTTLMIIISLQICAIIHIHTLHWMYKSHCILNNVFVLVFFWHGPVKWQSIKLKLAQFGTKSEKWCIQWESNPFKITPWDVLNCVCCRNCYVAPNRFIIWKEVLYFWLWLLNIFMCNKCLIYSSKT